MKRHLVFAIVLALASFASARPPSFTCPAGSHPICVLDATPIPTFAPTAVPTATRTPAAPTPTPSIVPTAAPTSVPTVAPTALPVGEFTLAPTSLTFSTQPVGTMSATQSVRVDNVTDAPFALAFTINGPFTQDGCTATAGWDGILAPHSHCDFSVAYTPLVPGFDVGSIVVQSGGATGRQTSSRMQHAVGTVGTAVDSSPLPTPFPTQAPTAVPSATPTFGPPLPTPVPGGNAPILPQAMVDTTLPTPTGQIINVSAGGNFQAALDLAQPGDVVELAAGATFTGNFILRPKADSSSKVWIRSSAWQQLPPRGTRVSPANASTMAKVISPNYLPAIATVGPASNYYLTGLEVTTAWNNTNGTAWNIIALGFQDPQGYNDPALTVSQLPDKVVFDRMYIHGHPTGNSRRGITMNSRATAVVDSYISEIHEVGADNQAIGGWNGTGPILIKNSYIEAACENMMFGGADTKFPNGIFADVTIVGNTFAKKLSWYVSDPSYAGIHWSVKNLFEMKMVARMLVDDNTFDTWFPDAQAFAAQLTVRNSNGTNPWANINDVTFTHNRFRNIKPGGLINFLAQDSPPPSGGGTSQRMTRVRVAYNVAEDMAGNAFQVLGGPIDLQIDHNTVLNANGVGTALSMSGAPSTRLVYTNNIMGAGQYFIFGDNVGVGDSGLNVYAPGVDLRGNVFYGPWPTPGGATPSHIAQHPGNYFPADRNAVGFVDLPGQNYGLSATSPYKGKATDGTDPGVNMNALP